MNEDEFYRKLAHWIGVQHGIKVDPMSLEVYGRDLIVEFKGTYVYDGSPTDEDIYLSFQDLVEAMCDE